MRYDIYIRKIASISIDDVVLLRKVRIFKWNFGYIYRRFEIKKLDEIAIKTRFFISDFYEKIDEALIKKNDIICSLNRIFIRNLYDDYKLTLLRYYSSNLRSQSKKQYKELVELVSPIRKVWV